jgi:ribonucleoside-diphosphate reductase alpha chain
VGQRESWLNEAVREALLEGAPATEIKAIPRRLSSVLVTAHQVAPEWHVRMQAAFPEHTDNAVSKTVNLAADASVQDVDRVFRLAFELGCKGTTVYRDGSRQGQTLSRAREGETPSVLGSATPRPRHRVTSGKTFKFRMGCGTLFVTVNRDESGLCEVFANLGKAGGCPSQSEATCRAVSVALRSGVEPRELIEQLRGIRCLSTARARKNGDEVDVLSCPDAIARAIEEGMGSSTPATPILRNICPDCGQPLRKHLHAGSPW